MRRDFLADNQFQDHFHGIVVEYPELDDMGHFIPKADLTPIVRVEEAVNRKGRCLTSTVSLDDDFTFCLKSTLTMENIESVKSSIQATNSLGEADDQLS